MAQVASENDNLLRKIQEVTNVSAPPVSPSVVPVPKGNVSFLQVGAPPYPAMKLLGGAPGGGEEEVIVSKAPLSPSVSGVSGSRNV